MDHLDVVKHTRLKTLIEYLDWPIYRIESSSIASPYIHETSRKISKIFEESMANAPSVILIDEMESYLTDRQHDSGTGMHHVEEVSEFLRRIPEANTNQVLIIGMTNRIKMIDDAIQRRGRFDHIVEVTMPTKAEIKALVTSHLSEIPYDKEISLDAVIIKLMNRPLSDVTFVLREACRLAAQNGNTELSQNNLEVAVERLPPKIEESKN